MLPVYVINNELIVNIEKINFKNIRNFKNKKIKKPNTLPYDENVKIGVFINQKFSRWKIESFKSFKLEDKSKRNSDYSGVKCFYKSFQI